MTSAMPLLFYQPAAPDGWLANFWASPFLLDGVLWQTVEHYYQAHKCAHPDLARAVRLAPGPAVAKDMARAHPQWRHVDWNVTKEGVMYRAIEAKFVQHRDLLRALLATGDRELVEVCPTDSYWASSGAGEGRNRMGVLLMRLRHALRERRERSVINPASISRSARRARPNVILLRPRRLLHCKTATQNSDMLDRSHRGIVKFQSLPKAILSGSVSCSDHPSGGTKCSLSACSFY